MSGKNETDDRVSAFVVTRDASGWRVHEIDVPARWLAKTKRSSNGNPWSVVTGILDGWLRELRDRTRGTS